MSKTKNVHGTAVLLGSTGVLLRGPSGAGKSLLALALLDRWQARGLPAFLIADDRVELSVGDSAIAAKAPETLVGQIELRGRGIIRRPHADGADLHLVIDLVPDLVRMLEDDDLTTDIDGVLLARAPVPTSDVVLVEHQMLLVAEAIAALAEPAITP
ncbi:HPr kinase/phosphatase C-terminal domain-containing protein [Devosia sp. 2618]|uniref:HPr kinase/phosphorylase n=1 Tax=Devosia sp. 2618 TaxID=3156454 RepID=UPI00339B19F5